MGYWGHVDFRFWNLDCGLKILKLNCFARLSALKSKIQILKSKLLIEMCTKFLSFNS